MKKIKNFRNFIVEDYSSSYSDIYSSPPEEQETQTIPDTTTKPQIIRWPQTDPDTQGDLNLDDMPRYSSPGETQTIPDTTTKPQIIRWPQTDPDTQGETKDPLYSLYSKFSQEEQEEQEFSEEEFSEEENIYRPSLSMGRKPKY